MKIEFEITIYELLFFIATIMAGIFALFQWRQSYKLERAKLVKEASSNLRDDKDMASALYAIDYGEEWYPFADHNVEQKFDRVFAFYNYLCYLRKKHILSKEEFRIFEYKIKRMSRNKSSLKYLFYIYHFATKNKTDVSFYHLLEYMKKNELLKDDFWDVTSTKYLK